MFLAKNCCLENIRYKGSHFETNKCCLWIDCPTASHSLWQIENTHHIQAPTERNSPASNFPRRKFPCFFDEFWETLSAKIKITKIQGSHKMQPLCSHPSGVQPGHMSSDSLSFLIKDCSLKTITCLPTFSCSCSINKVFICRSASHDESCCCNRSAARWRDILCDFSASWWRLSSSSRIRSSSKLWASFSRFRAKLSSLRRLKFSCWRAYRKQTNAYKNTWNDEPHCLVCHVIREFIPQFAQRSQQTALRCVLRVQSSFPRVPARFGPQVLVCCLSPPTNDATGWARWGGHLRTRRQPWHNNLRIIEPFLPVVVRKNKSI